MGKQLKWGILATGNIAGTFAKALPHSKTGKLVAVGSRSQESANRFGDEFNVPRRHGSYEALLADPEVQAVYIATPHPQHAEWTMKCAQARKHLLVEKPIGLNHAEAMAMIEAAIEHDVFLMEAFMYRCNPQTVRLVELIKSGAIGDVRVIQATFSFHWPKPWNAESRITSNALGGGGILDVGCYPVSMSRLIAGAATGRDFADPIDVKASGHLGVTGVDEWTCAVLKFPGEIVAQVSTGVQVNQENVVRIYGSEGSLFVPHPWAPAKEGGIETIYLQRSTAKEPEAIRVETSEWLYAIEADVVARNIARRQAPSPSMSWEDTLGNMKTLDAWRAQVGVEYDAEKPERFAKTTISGRPLAIGSKGKIPHGTIPHLEKSVSRLVMGCDNQPTLAHAAVMFDDFLERGGNAFDTAFIYRAGFYERLLGQWAKNRGVREQIAVIVKGAHTPYCYPKYFTEQLHESLERLQMDYADIYMLHRDNLEVPVGEFVDVLNEHVRAGRIRAFGGSNWTLERVAEANAYAAKNNLQGFSVVSNNFSLARMVEAPWPGCVSSSDRASRRWLEKHQMALLGWSSQARGFFIEDKAHPQKREDAELVRCWYSEDNFERLRRAKELAAKKNVRPINIALAYVLHQKFLTFALIGPRVLSETRTSLPGAFLELSEAEVRWLDLEDHS
ncbi:MAG TPA: aldo/keto reductase [Tepidisphaeraceae bacterium]|jgi:predicted dehydrogenase/aryl-alcohol dehydrogenase-like predicted oxidoreductase